MKILYVEDNPANVFLVKRVARMGNHEIINYIDGDKALEKYSEIAPDLVLMDIQLAGNKSGLDVVKSLREKGVKTPIIAVTAYAMVGDKERCIEAGCDDYLAKPLPIQRLVEMFKSYSESAAKSQDTSPATPEKTPEATPEQTVTASTPEKSAETSAVSTVTPEKSEEASSPVVSENTEAKGKATSEETNTGSVASSEAPETIAATVTPENTEATNPVISEQPDTGDTEAEKIAPKNPAEVDKSDTIESISEENIAPVSESKPETELSSVVESTPVSASAESDVTEKLDSAGELSTGEKNL